MRYTRSHIIGSTRDTQAGPTLTWNGFQLELDYVDSCQTARHYTFADVYHFTLGSSDEVLYRELHDDAQYEVIQSDLIHALILCGEFSEEDASKYRHVVIGFHDIGSFLDIVFQEVEAK